ncbi:hypothetical protein GF343_05280 [Candidatus Woesearchaeota archaeon]|nr:hypothetical protein [Candidatus Woesearchaeota archaeon]
MESLKETVAQKPWSSEEKERVLGIIERGREKKTKKTRFLDEFVYWVFLFISILGNFVLSVVLVPFMLILTGFYLFAVLFIIGFAFGLLINSIMREIQKIEAKKHIIPILLIVALALINVYIITTFTNRLEVLLEVATPAHNPIIISATYALAFILPYLFSEYRLAMKRRAASS